MLKTKSIKIPAVNEIIVSDTVGNPKSYIDPDCCEFFAETTKPQTSGESRMTSRAVRRIKYAFLFIIFN